jgi:16S rRNA processing protein RimM
LGFFILKACQRLSILAISEADFSCGRSYCSPMKKEELIKMGFVAHPHGIKGEAELRLANQEDSILEDGMKLWLFPSSAKSKINPAGEERILEKVRFGNKVIATFEGVKDRTHLESLIPFEFYMDRNDFPETEEGEIYLVDLINIDVVNEKGEIIGKLESFDDNGMQYLLNIRLEPVGELITLPYVDTFFPEVDLEKKQITMIMPEYTE